MVHTAGDHYSNVQYAITKRKFEIHQPSSLTLTLNLTPYPNHGTRVVVGPVVVVGAGVVVSGPN